MIPRPEGPNSGARSAVFAGGRGGPCWARPQCITVLAARRTYFPFPVFFAGCGFACAFVEAAFFVSFLPWFMPLVIAVIR